MERSIIRGGRAAG